MGPDGFTDLPLQILGGMVTDMPAAELPAGASPRCIDCAFPQGSVGSRNGLKNQFAALAGTPSVMGLKTFATTIPNPAQNSFKKVMLASDSLGNVYQEAAPGVLSLAASGLSSKGYMKSSTLFGREFMGFSDGALGMDLPWQFDGVNFDRVSQYGPAEGPAAVDSATSGSITIGNHQVAVVFITRQDYYTQPSPPTTWNAAGGKKVKLTLIATGPSNVIARLLIFTATGDDDFYYLPSTMLIPDNSTTSITIDFADTALLNGASADSLFDQVVLGGCAGCVGYNNRTAWWGERNKLQYVRNPDFDGGWDEAFNYRPLGWSLDPTYSGGGQQASFAVWGGAYEILFDGVTANRGMILQPAILDIFGDPLIQSNIAYSIRIRLTRTSPGAVTGAFAIDLFSPSGGGSGIFGIAMVPMASIPYTPYPNVTFKEFIVPLIGPNVVLPSDLQLRMYVGGTPGPNGAGVIADCMEIFPTATPYITSTARVSTVNDPESFDGVTGLITVGANDGQAIKCMVSTLWDGNLYLLKDRGFFSSTDDGVNEPSSWPAPNLSTVVGALSAQSCSGGEDWFVTACRAGLYIYYGGTLSKLSGEIYSDADNLGRPTWDQINWEDGNTIFTVVDPDRRRMYVGAPSGGSTVRLVFMLDYRGLMTASDIASYWNPHYSTYTGKIISLGHARKWSAWNITAPCGAMIERVNGTAQMFFGGVGDGNIKQETPLYYVDDVSVGQNQINFDYVTYFAPTHEEEEQMQLGSHRKLFGYITGYVTGAGTVNLNAYGPGFVNMYSLPEIPVATMQQDWEMLTDISVERCCFEIAAASLGSWMLLQKLVPGVKPDPVSPLRGF